MSYISKALQITPDADDEDTYSQRSTKSQDMQHIVATTATQIGVALAQVLGKNHVHRFFGSHNQL